MRCLSVVGARPQFIKAAIVERALRDSGVEVWGVHTGQHYDAKLCEPFFDQLELESPKFNLGVGSASHGVQTARMLEGLEQVILDTAPDLVVAYGDTNSTLAAVLAASKLHVPVGHVEAGLRSGNRAMAEEQNRIVADHLSTLLFAPSRTAMTNLTAEGLAGSAILTGDVMYDAFDAMASSLRRGEGCESYGLEPGKFVLATVHRAENADDAARLRDILHGLGGAPLPVLLPVHPRTRRQLEGITVPSNIHVVDPVGYREMLALERDCARIATDSGGVQKEAAWAGVPCVTLRDETEWTETLAGGWNVLVGADPDRIAAALCAPAPAPPPPALSPCTPAAPRIADAIVRCAT